MRLSTPRRRNDADVIRARLRALLDTGASAPGWLPDDDLDDLDDLDHRGGLAPTGAGHGDHPYGQGDDGHRAEASTVGPAPPGGRHRRPGTAVRLDPGRRGAWALWVAGLLAALVLAAWAWSDRPRTVPAPARPVAATTAAPRSPAVAAAHSGAPRATPPDGTLPTTGTGPATVVVSVVGQVARPGLVTLSAGARVADALAAAGGVLPQGDAGSVNLAAVLTDGQQLAVGVPGAPAAAIPGSAGGSRSAPAGPIDLNAATAGDLDGLPGIGPVLAQRIVDYRQQHGRFSSVDQLDDVPGIGPALYSRLAGQVRV